MYARCRVPRSEGSIEDYTMSADIKRFSANELIPLLHDPDPVVRLHAGFVLGSLGDEATQAIPVLIEMLQSNDVHDQKLAAMTLGEIGPAASEAIPLLLHAANGENEWLADAAIWALEEIDVIDTDIEAEAA
jgi:HEAT repeat protein